jgi:hypothetical protein
MPPREIRLAGGVNPTRDCEFSEIETVCLSCRYIDKYDKDNGDIDNNWPILSGNCKAFRPLDCLSWFQSSGGWWKRPIGNFDPDHGIGV